MEINKSTRVFFQEKWHDTKAPQENTATCHLYTSHSKVPETKTLPEEMEFRNKILLVISLFITELKSEYVATMSLS